MTFTPPPLQQHDLHSRRHTAGSQCCSRIQIEGADKQKARQGVYVLMTVTQNGRSVYKQTNGTTYLSYWPAYKAWLVGPDYTKAIAGIHSTIGEGAACPSLATDWYESDGVKWTMRRQLQVTCTGAQYAPPSFLPTALRICMCVRVYFRDQTCIGSSA